MDKEFLNIEKYIYNFYGKYYYIYLFPEDNNITSFYIQRKDCGFISYLERIDIAKSSVEEFITKNIQDWAGDYEYDLEKLENETFNTNTEI